MTEKELLKKLDIKYWICINCKSLNCQQRLGMYVYPAWQSSLDKKKDGPICNECYKPNF